MKVREGGRVVKIAVMVATGVNADGYREVLGVATSTAESGTGWNTFFKDLVARGLNGVALVTSEAVQFHPDIAILVSPRVMAPEVTRADSCPQLRVVLVDERPS